MEDNVIHISPENIEVVDASEYCEDFTKIIYVFLTIFLYLLKCPQSLIL